VAQRTLGTTSGTERSTSSFGFETGSGGGDLDRALTRNGADMTDTRGIEHRERFELQRQRCAGGQGRHIALVFNCDGERAGDWQPRRNIYTNTGDVILTGAAASVALGMAIMAPLSKHPRGGVLFDEAARDALRIGNLDSRYMIRDASDVGASITTTWPFLVDALLTAWWYRGDVKLARNMALVAAEAMAITAAAQGLTNTITSRERPYGRLCGGDLPENSVDCEGNVRFRSFFSGHSSITFAAAGVMCWHHVGLGLIGKQIGRAHV